MQLKCKIYTTRIKSIIKLKQKEETYDLKVYPTHNFFLSNGILTHNSGKSTLSFQVARYVDPTFNLERVVFNVDTFLDALIKAQPGQAIVFDEAIIVNSRSALTEFNKKIIVAMTQIRSKGLFIFFNIPSVFDLDRNLCLNRAHLLLHCYQDNFGERGRYTVFNKDKMKLLYLKGKRLYSYGFPKANFYAKFSEYFPLDREAYERKKQKEIARIAKSNKNEKASRQVSSLIRIIYRDLLPGKTSYEKVQWISDCTEIPQNEIQTKLRARDFNMEDANLGSPYLKHYEELEGQTVQEKTKKIVAPENRRQSSEPEEKDEEEDALPPGVETNAPESDDLFAELGIPLKLDDNIPDGVPKVNGSTTKEQRKKWEQGDYSSD